MFVQKYCLDNLKVNSSTAHITTTCLPLQPSHHTIGSNFRRKKLIHDKPRPHLTHKRIRPHPPNKLPRATVVLTGTICFSLFQQFSLSPFLFPSCANLAFDMASGVRRRDNSSKVWVCGIQVQESRTLQARLTTLSHLRPHSLRKTHSLSNPMRDNWIIPQSLGDQG